MTEGLMKDESSSVSGNWHTHPLNASRLAAAVQTRAVVGADANAQQHMGVSFAQIVAVLMRDPNYANLKIADLETLVLPPVMAGQFKLAHGTRRSDASQDDQRAFAFPVGVALWARVSPEVDQWLSSNLDKKVWLRPAEWTSGDILWMMTVAGHARTLPAFLKQLEAEEFKGKPVKMRVMGANGKAVLQTLGAST